MMKLYGTPPTRTLRVIWLLNELGLDYEMHPVDQRSPRDVDVATQECIAMVAVLEQHMAERKFVVGDRLSVADFNAAYTLDWADEANMLDDAPRLKAYRKSMYARPTAPPTIAEAFAKMES